MARPHRLDALDAMRGIAALAVVIFHAGPSLLGRQPLPGAYLAVDFFFLLSGFVLARAFDARLPELGVRGFMRLRLKRLYPVMAASIAVGAALSLAHDVAPLQVAVRLIAQLLFVPIPLGPYELYPLNGVQWSLACELAANLIHATLLTKRSPVLPIAIFAVCGALLVAGAVRHGSLSLGDMGDSWAWGFARVGCSYALGMALYRLKPQPQEWPSWAGPLALGALIVVRAVVRHEWVASADLALVLIGFPLVLMIGAGATRQSALGQLAGGVSYPLYAFHLAVLALVERALPQGLPALITGVSLAVALALAINARGGMVPSISRVRRLA